jgi:hypothetical protein
MPQQYTADVGILWGFEKIILRVMEDNKKGGSRAIRFADCLGVLGYAQNSTQTNALEFAKQTPTQSAMLIAPSAGLCPATPRWGP